MDAPRGVGEEKVRGLVFGKRDVLGFDERGA